MKKKKDINQIVALVKWALEWNLPFKLISKPERLRKAK